MVIVLCSIARCITFGVPCLPVRPCDERPPAMYGHFCLVPRVSVHDRYYCTPATEIHQHSTRAASKLFITRANHEFAKKSLRHSIIVTVNNTITSITNKTLTHSLDGFAKYVKKSIIQSYESNCSINNCYVCSSLDP